MDMSFPSYAAALIVAHSRAPRQKHTPARQRGGRYGFRTERLHKCLDGSVGVVSALHRSMTAGCKTYQPRGTIQGLEVLLSDESSFYCCLGALENEHTGVDFD